MQTAQPGQWTIELAGSEIARVERRGDDIVVVLSAARVRGDRSQLDATVSGGHLHGVSCHLLQASCEGDASALFGRIDEASWQGMPTSGTFAEAMLNVPSEGASTVRLTLRTGLGDELSIQARAWRIEVALPLRFTPSLAC